MSVFPFFKKSNWHLKGVLRCAFANEFEVFWIVQGRGTLAKLRALRSSHRRVFVKKGILRNFANFTGRHLCQSLFFNKVAGLRVSGLQLFIKIETLAQVFSGEFCEISKNTFFTEHLWAAVSMLFKNLPFRVGYWHVLEYNLGGQTPGILAKRTAKLGVLVKIYIFSWDNMVFLWGICSFPEKMTLFFSILNK